MKCFDYEVLLRVGEDEGMIVCFLFFLVIILFNSMVWFY